MTTTAAAKKSEKEEKRKKKEKVVECLECNSNVVLKRRAKNPHSCTTCGALFNVVQRTVKIPILPINDTSQEQLDKLLEVFPQIGAHWMSQFIRRFFASWRIVETEKNGICAGCEGKKDLSFFSKESEAKYCYSCAQPVIYGKRVKDEVMKDLQALFPEVTEQRKTIFHMVYDAAVVFFEKWLKDNWGKFIRRVLVEEELAASVKRMQDFLPATQDHPVVAEIRASYLEYVQDRTPMCPARFFLWYKQGRDVSREEGKEVRASRRRAFKTVHLDERIVSGYEEFGFSKRNRKRRKHGLSDSESVIQYAVAESEASCSNLEKFEWGFECTKEQAWFDTKASRFPRFPSTRADIAKKTYDINVETQVVAIDAWDKRRSWKQPRGVQTIIPNTEWMTDRYGFVFGDNERYPYIWAPKGGLYHLMYPITTLAKARDEGWKHAVAYGPKETVVWSSRGKVKHQAYFNHSQILTIKQESQARKGKRPRVHARYLKNRGVEGSISMLRTTNQRRRFNPKRYSKVRPRQREGRQVNLLLHEETLRIAEYLSNMPGEVTVLNMNKPQYGRGDEDRRELNRRNSAWSDGIFRQLLAYKVLLAGLSIKEKECVTSDTAHCPYHEDCELSGSWQDLIVVNNKTTETCNRGSEVNILLAMAMAA